MRIHISWDDGHTHLAQNDPTLLLRCALHLLRPRPSLFDVRAHVWYRQLHSYPLRSGSKGQGLAQWADRSRWNMWLYAVLEGAERGTSCSKSPQTLPGAA